MRLLDALTVIVLGAQKPNTYISFLYYNAPCYFAAHVGCLTHKHPDGKLKEVLLYEEEPVGVHQYCYFCGNSHASEASYQGSFSY